MDTKIFPVKETSSTPCTITRFNARAIQNLPPATNTTNQRAAFPASATTHVQPNPRYKSVTGHFASRQRQQFSDLSKRLWEKWQRNNGASEKFTDCPHHNSHPEKKGYRMSKYKSTWTQPLRRLDLKPATA